MQIYGKTPEQMLDSFLELPHELEWVEFKEAKNDFSFDQIGKYFSAVSNEAFLKEQDWGWLLLGVRNDHSICGTAYRQNAPQLQRLKHEIASQTSSGITLEEIHVVNHSQGRVVMFQIPPAEPGVPTDWKGHWYGRNGDSLVALSLSKLKRIIAGTTELTETERFENYLLDYDNWSYDGIDTAVYLVNADFAIKIESAEEWRGAGNYWWGKLLHEKPISLWYRLICKGQEVGKILVMLFHNECLKVPFPEITTVAHPHADIKTPYYADVFYYRRNSMAFKLLCHIRAAESGPPYPALYRTFRSLSLGYKATYYHAAVSNSGGR